ncbi:MAG: multicopper oxidase type 2 [Gammaproteobacteria bacterium]|nr:multicopper oxidase type 2 [Gammaproteobacteria bacterium]
MSNSIWSRRGLSALVLCLATLPAAAQSFRVQCPKETKLHPAGSSGTDAHPGGIKCQEIAGGDGFATMADGNQIYLFGFGPLSGRDYIDQGLPGTQSAEDFNKDYSATNANGAAIEPAAIMNLGVLSAQEPAPLMAIDEDDEFFLTLSNVGQIMRPDLFEQHTVHFHGYPNASSFFDGVPDASAAINIMGSFTYYYTAPDAGTYFWHCHITPPEHLQMGMVGQLFVRPRQNQVHVGVDLATALYTSNLKAPGNPDGVTCSDILCTGQTPLPAAAVSTHVSNVLQPAGDVKYAYNDGDGSTKYDVEYPIQLMGFDPNFHYVGMTFNPEAFADMKDKYFMISGRGYPDTVNTYVNNTGTGKPDGPLYTLDSDGASRSSQPLPSLIKITRSAGQTRALLRISDLNVTEFHTIATVGVPMLVIADNARLLRDMAGRNLYYKTNSLTLGGGESADVILDVSSSDYATCTNTSPCTFYLYTTNLDHLSNDAENFGGMMTEIQVL